jgi:hypothetical protein
MRELNPLKPYLVVLPETSEATIPPVVSTAATRDLAEQEALVQARSKDGDQLFRVGVLGADSSRTRTALDLMMNVVYGESPWPERPEKSGAP